MLRLRPFAAFICLALVLCFIGLWSARSQSGGLRRVTNTTEEGFNTNPSLSGDGSRIAFESSKDLTGGGGSNFPRAFRADVGSDTIAFLQMAAARAPAPGISQDGSIIAFAARENPLGTNPDGNSEIFLFDGSTLRQITNTTPATPSDRTRHGNFLPSLSDNGRFIAFSSNRNPAGQNGDGNFEIFIFDTLLNSFSQLTNTAGAVGATDAKISGDGSRIAYIRDNNALPAVQRDLVLQDRVGGATQVPASGVLNLALTYGRAISDDGSRVVYSVETAANSSQLFLFDGRRNSVRQLISLGAREDDVPLHATISGDGSRVSFATRRAITALAGNTDNSIELYIYDIPTGQLARVTNAPTNADCFDASNRACEVVSSLNDDGSVVAFNFPRSLSGTVTSGTENNTEIYITGTAPRPVTGSLNIVNGASFGNEPATTEAIAPDSIAVAFGGALSFETIEASRQADGSFPRVLGGTTVRVNGRLAQIFFVSPTRVHFHVPAETELGTAEVVITNDEGFRSVGTIAVRSAAPGIFTFNEAGQFTLFDDGRGPGAILNADTFTRGPFDPSGGNLRLVIFTTGGRKAPQITATAGGRALTVESYLPSPDLPGLDEVRVLVPADLRGVGTVDLVIRAEERDSNPVLVTFSGGPRDIVINEVLADPPDGPQGDANHDGTRSGSDDEFVELVNTTAINLDISGYRLFTRSTTSNDALRHTFAPGTIFPAGSAIVVFGGGTPEPTNPAFGGAQIFTASSGGLNLINSGGVVTLREPSQAIAAIFSYGSSIGLNGDANQSLTRAPDITGDFFPHTQAPGGNGNDFSPGTKIDGNPFASGQGRLTRITILPPSVSISVGQTTQFTAQAFDQFNRPLRNVTITFASDNTNVASVDAVTMDAMTGIATGSVTVRGVGTAHITAQATDGTTTVTSSQATLTVNPVPAVVTRVEVSPTNTTINRGQPQQLTATAFDQNNQPIAAATFSWNSSNPNIATIDANGLATGVGLGSATITATISDATGATVSGMATLAVQVPLVINEILADPPDGISGDANRDSVRDADDDEFVELVNNSDTPVDISGVIVADSTSNRFTFPANTTLAAGRAIVIFGGGTPPANDPAFGGALVFTTTSLSLGNTGDTVIVKLAVGGTDAPIATQTYGSEGNDNQSLTRSPDLTGAVVKHASATNSDGRVFSPGTRVDGTPFGSPPITRIEVTPTSAAKDVGATQTFTARAFSNTSGTEIEVQNVSFIWDSSDTSVATVQPATGQSTTALAVAPSTATIRARAGGQERAATFTINSTPPVLTSVTISPLSATINAGQTQQFTGQALDQFGQPLGGVTVTFASNNTTVATVDSVSPTSSTGSATAIVTGQINGSAEISATATNGTTTVTSTPATLTVAPVASPGDVVISEFRTRGPDGANDEFIELYNRTTAPIDISGYKIFRSNNAGATNLTATINAGVILGPGCHYLLTNSNAGGPYSGLVAGDQTYGTGITADGGIALTVPSGTATTGIIDQVGLTAGSAYKEGTPLAPFAGDAEQSYERKPGGASGNGTDTNNNASDFLLNASSSNPQNLSSGCLDLSTADLAITKTDSPDPVTTGSDVTYTITVTNNGPGTAQSVVVTDNLPGTVTFVSCSSTGIGQCGGTGNNRTITFASLESGASATITLVATANGAAGTTITNTVSISSATSDAYAGNNSATATTAVQAATALPSLTINDVAINEGNTGTTTFTFTVSLSSAAPTGGVTFDIATQDDTATLANNDYVARNLTGQTIPSGQQTYTFDVTVNGDTVVEPNETFFVNITNLTGATLSDGQGVGTINNDDSASPTGNIVISQIYGGGGNTGAPFTHDFIEIFNRGTTAVDVTGWSVQYNSATGAGAFQLTPICPTGTCLIQPGKYFLVQEASNAAVGNPLPTPDATGTIIMAAGAGRVALVNSTTPIPAGASCGQQLAAAVDFVGYGTTATCFEGSGPAPAPSATTADLRASNGCVDTNDNAADFLAATPNPRNTASPLNDCNAVVIPNISINDATVTEGNSGAVTATFTVSLSSPAPAGGVSFDIATQDNTATVANNDYVAKSLTGQTIAAGQQTFTFAVTVNGDTAVEPNETFFVNLTNVVGATVTDNQGTGTIQNDDSAPGVIVTSVVVSPASPTINSGQTQQFAATAFDQNNQPVPGATFTWSSTPTSVATIDSNGLATGVGVGTATITATTSDGAGGNVSGTATLTVNAPPVATYIVTGQVRDNSNNPVSGVLITFELNSGGTLSTQTTQTDVNGNYSSGDLGCQNNVKVTPSKTGFIFTPSAIAFTSTGCLSGSDVANFTAAPPPPGTLVISQFYVGGGNANATYTHDFVEIFNSGTTTVDFSVTPYSIQFVGTGASFGSTSASNKTNITSGTIAPGQYFLVQEASGGAVGAALPAADATGTINLLSAGGKVALVVGTTALPVSTCPGDDGASPFIPSNPAIADFVGYGGNANTVGHCYEGPGPAAAPSSTNADFRKAGGCVDTNFNADDFLVAAPSPRNTSSPLNDCSAVPTPNLSINDVTQNEGNSGATVFTFTVTLSSAAPAGGVTFDIATQDGTATLADNDYVAQSLTGRSIPAGQQTYTFDVTVNGDTGVEPNETFFINVTNVSGANVTDGQALGTIQNDDSSPLPTLTINDVTQNEGSGGTATFTFTVSLSSAAPAGGVTFNIATADGTAQDDNPATEDNDYVARSLTAQTIPAGQQTFTFDVSVNGDTAVEANETFFVNVTNVSGANITDGQGVGTITNDDAANLVISQVYGGGGNSGAPFNCDYVELFNRGTSAVDFAVTPFSVQYATATGNFGGTGNGDKTDLTTGTIAAGGYFLVKGRCGAIGSSFTADYTPATATTGLDMAAGAGKVALVSGVAASAATACPTNVTVADLVGYGTTASCFEGAGHAPTPSATTADFRKAGGCLDTNENANDFLVVTPNPRNSSSPLNDCSAGLKPEITINDPAAVAESTANATFTVTLSTASALTVTVDYSTADGTATAVADYQSTSGTLTFAPGEISKSIPVPIINDTTDEPSETFFVNLTNATNSVFLDNQGQGTITDNDSAPTISINDVSVTEGDSGTISATFNVTLSTASGFSVTVNYATADSSATAGSDYQSTNGTLTFNPGQTTQTITVLVNGDTTFETNETFLVNLTAPTNASILDNQGQGTITNDDAAPPVPAITINDVSVAEGDSGTKTVDFTVSLSMNPTTTVTVDYATANGTATAGSDYQSASGTLTFNTGETSKPISVTINGDTLVEPDETFFVNLSNASANAIITDAQGVGTITNDDTANLVISQVYGGGGNANAPYQNDFIEIFNQGTTTVVFSVTNYSVQYASATSSGTFSAANKTDLTIGTIAPGQYFLVQEAATNTASCGNAPCGILLPTPDATGNIGMSATAGKVALVVGTATLQPPSTCPGDDGASPLNPSDSTIADFVGYGGSITTTGHCYEGAAPAAAPSATTADFRKAGGCLDTDENTNDFLVSAPNPRNTLSPLNDCSGGLKPEITINDRALSEGTTNVVFTVTLSTASALTVTVDYSTADGTATAGADYQATSGTLTFAPGETTKTINVTVINDTLDEPNETYFVNLSNASNGTILDSQGQGTINDNDATPSLSINDPSTTEGHTGTKTLDFTVTLSAASGQTVTVNYATSSASPATAVADDDYQSTSGTLTFNPGDLTKTISVTINGDTTIEPDETFFVDLTGATNATISDPQGQGTITNDDFIVDLSITKTDSPDPVNAGSDITYTLTVTNNTASASAQNVVVTDTLPVNTTLVSVGTPLPSGWTRTDTVVAGGTGTISFTTPSMPGTGADSTATFTITVKVAAATAEGTNISNTANVTSDTTDNVSGNNSSTATTLVHRPADLSLTKTVDNASQNVGQMVTFTITLNNLGPFDDTSVQVTDLLPSGLLYDSSTVSPGTTYDSGTGLWNVGTLNNGASATLTLKALVQTAGAKTNTATITQSDQFDPDTANNQSSATVTPPQANLSITKSAAPEPVTPGGTLTYTIVVTNNGPDMAQSIVVSDSLPNTLTFVSCSAPGGSCSYADANVTANFSSLANGATATLTIETTVSNSAVIGSTISNTASVSAATFDSDGTNNSASATTTVQAATLSADLAITKSAPGTVVAGDNLTYTINLNNIGPDAASSASVTDALPSGTTFQSATAPVGWATNAPSVNANGTVTFTKSTVAASETAAFTIVVKVGSNVSSGTIISNSAVASTTTTDPTSGNNTGTAMTTVNTQADLVVTKNGAGSVVAGTNLSYSISLTNNGLSDAQNVQLDDPLPPNTTFVSFTQDTGPAFSCSTPAVGPMTCTISTLAAGATATFTFVVNVAPNAANGSTISNSATASTDTTDPTTPNTGTVMTTVTTAADLAVTKTDSPATLVAAGSNITYDINFINNGPSYASTVSITDTVPANTTFISAAVTTGSGWTPTAPLLGGTGDVVFSKSAVAPGETAVFQVVVQVNASTVGGTVITNSATATSATTDPGPKANTGQATTTVSATAGQVIINEVLVDTSNTTTRPDFLELYNQTNQAIDISGLIISFRATTNTSAITTVTLPGTIGSGMTTIAANSYFLVANGATVLNSAGSASVAADFNAPANGFTLNFNNTTGAVKIELNGIKLDGFAYQTGATAAPAIFNGFGEGAIFNQTSSAATKDFSRIPNATDTDVNANDFRLNTSVGNVTPKDVNTTPP